MKAKKLWKKMDDKYMRVCLVENEEEHPYPQRGAEVVPQGVLQKTTHE